jgi:SAM-dependent methyltransferase
MIRKTARTDKMALSPVVRPAGRTGCPICNREPGETILKLDFPKKLGLPESIALVECADCDLAYVVPVNQERYDEYYRSVQNDVLHEEIVSSDSRDKADRRYDAQASRLKAILSRRSRLDVLDYGCGTGGLLRVLSDRFPHHTYYGFDLSTATTRNSRATSANAPWGPNIEFFDAGASHKEFEFIILSHFLEHLVDLNALRNVLRLLKPGGTIYIEVPNSAEYKNYRRREYLYYVDRLHVNHFSRYSLRRLTQSFGLLHLRTASCTFPYKDGEPYPALYTFAKKDSRRSASLKSSLKEYISRERNSKTPTPFRNHKNGVIVYGFGDNFFRARSAGGPLSKAKILAVVDKRANELRQSEYSTRFEFLDLDEAVERFPQAPFIVAVSWNAGPIIASIRQRTKAPVHTV